MDDSLKMHTPMSAIGSIQDGKPISRDGVSWKTGSKNETCCISYKL